MKKMLWNQDGLTWEIAKYDGATWPMWSVTNDDGKFFMSESLYDCILWAELETGKEISMLDVFSG